MSPTQARAELQRLVEQNARPFPIDRAALLLAVDEYPRLNPGPYLARLDGYALQIEAALPDGRAGADPRRRLGLLRRVLFEEESFHGDRDNYYDPRNSYLNEVLDRRLGIPITLSVVVLAIGGRLGWPLDGVSFPSHFLVRYVTEAEPLAIDPFHGGLILGPEELSERWLLATGTEPPPLAQMLEPAAPRAVLLRILENVRRIHHSTARYDLAALATEKSLLLEPDSPRYQYELAQLYLGAKNRPAAEQQLRKFIERFPHSAAVADARRQLQLLESDRERDAD